MKSVGIMNLHASVTAHGVCLLPLGYIILSMRVDTSDGLSVQISPRQLFHLEVYKTFTDNCESRRLIKSDAPRINLFRCRFRTPCENLTPPQ